MSSARDGELIILSAGKIHLVSNAPPLDLTDDEEAVPVAVEEAADVAEATVGAVLFASLLAVAPATLLVSEVVVIALEVVIVTAATAGRLGDNDDEF